MSPDNDDDVDGLLDAELDDDADDEDDNNDDDLLDADLDENDDDEDDDVLKAELELLELGVVIKAPVPTQGAVLLLASPSSEVARYAARAAGRR